MPAVLDFAGIHTDSYALIQAVMHAWATNLPELSDVIMLMIKKISSFISIR